MRHVTTSAELVELLDAGPIYGYAVGLLPGVAPDCVTWFRPVTLQDAVTAQNATAIEMAGEYTESAGDLELLARSVLVDPEAFRSGLDMPTLADPDRLEPLFANRADVERMLGDPLVGGSAANALRAAVMEANGFVWSPPSEEEQAQTLDECRALAARGVGVWVDGVFPSEPEAAVWVTTYSEAVDSAATDAARQRFGDSTIYIRDRGLSIKLAAVVRTGPGGDPLMTRDEARRLPWGCALHLARVATTLTEGGRYGEVGFCRPDATGPGPDDAGDADVVDGGVPTPDPGGDDDSDSGTTDRGDGDAPDGEGGDRERQA